MSPITVDKIGCKKAIIAGCCAGTCYYCTNLYPRIYTLVPTVLVFGFLGNVLMTAKSNLVTNYAIDLARASGKDAGDLISEFHGINIAFFKITNIFGNLISWLILKQSSHFPVVDTRNNETLLFNVSEVDYIIRGTRFYDTNSSIASACSIYNDPSKMQSLHFHESTMSAKPDKNLVLLLVGVYVSMAVIGSAGGLFLVKDAHDRDPSTGEGKLPHVPETQMPDLRQSLLSTFLLLRQFNMAALVPMVLFSSLQIAFLYAEFTKAFVACELGIEWVGYTMMCYGVTSAISPWVFGHLHKWIGFPINYTAAGIINMALFIQMLVYPVSKEHLGYFFFIPGIWGVLNGMWQSRTLALLGIHFSHNQRPAFANYHLWQGVGFTVSFAYGNLLCVATKIYICMTMLVLSLLLYYVVEIKTRIEKKKQLAEEGTADEKTNGEIPEAEKLAPNGISEDGAKKLALSTVSLPNVLTIPFKQSDLYLYANDVNFLAASTGSMIARWDSMSRDQFHSAVKARSKDSIHA